MCLATWTNSEPLLWARFLLLTLTASTKGKYGACFSPLPDLVAGLACEEGGETGFAQSVYVHTKQTTQYLLLLGKRRLEGLQSFFSPEQVTVQEWQVSATALCQHSASQERSAWCSRMAVSARWGSDNQTERQRQDSSRSECTQPGGFQMLMGLHASFIHFVLESSLLLVLLRVNLSLRFVWLNGPKVWHCDGAFCRHILS